jgi:hypothetical protein
MDPNTAFKTQLLWDRSNHLVWIHYPSSPSGVLDRCVVYHVLTQRWGVANRTIEQAINYISPQLTYAGLTRFATYADLPSISYNSLYWVAGAQQPAIIGTDHKIAQLSGVAGSAYFVTGDYGDEAGYTFCSNVRLRYTQSPSSSIMTGYTRDTAGGSLATGTARSVSDGQHHLRQRARFHRFRVATTGDFKLAGIRPQLKPAGIR